MLLKIKMALHAFIGIFSCGFALIMILQTHTEMPNVFCWICAIVGIINAIYSFAMSFRCEEKIKRGEQ